MKRTLSLIFITVLVSFFVFLFFFTQEEKQDTTCKNLIVIIKDSTERNFLSQKDIVTFLKNKQLYPVDKLMSEVNTDAMERKLIENELIAEVNVFKTPSGGIKVEVYQKMPILRVFSSGGSYYVDESGKTMPASHLYATYLPIASGSIEKSLAITDLYKFALFLHKHEFWNNQIEQIYVHPNKEVELIPRVGKHRIILGDFEDFSGKMDYLQLFYEQAIPKLGWEKYDAISLKYKNQIVCTKK